MEPQIDSGGWSAFALTLAQFAETRPIWFIATIVAPSLIVVGALIWFVRFMGAERISRLARDVYRPPEQPLLPGLEHLEKEEGSER